MTAGRPRKRAVGLSSSMPGVKRVRYLRPASSRGTCEAHDPSANSPLSRRTGPRYCGLSSLLECGLAEPFLEADLAESRVAGRNQRTLVEFGSSRSLCPEPLRDPSTTVIGPWRPEPRVGRPQATVKVPAPLCFSSLFPPTAVAGCS